jgi:hypothetical protein
VRVRLVRAVVERACRRGWRDTAPGGASEPASFQAGPACCPLRQHASLLAVSLALTLMTTHAGFIVTLDRDLNGVEAEAVLTALRMVKGVVRVEPVKASPELHIAQARADERWRQRLRGLIQDSEKASVESGRM